MSHECKATNEHFLINYSTRGHWIYMSLRSPRFKKLGKNTSALRALPHYILRLAE